jgi:hypothetical protein
MYTSHIEAILRESPDGSGAALGTSGDERRFVSGLLRVPFWGPKEVLPFRNRPAARSERLAESGRAGGSFRTSADRM